MILPGGHYAQEIILCFIVPRIILPLPCFHSRMGIVWGFNSTCQFYRPSTGNWFHLSKRISMVMASPN